MGRTKVFLSHAHEDKESFVRPFAEALKEYMDVWYDEYELTVGDKLRRRIEDGLRDCDYGIVVLSHAFFSKKWPQAELDGLFELEGVDRKLILPVLHRVTMEEAKTYSPILAGRLVSFSSSGVEKVVDEIRRAVDASYRTRVSDAPSWKSKLTRQSKDIIADREVAAYIQTQEATEQVSKSIQEIVAGLAAAVDEMNAAAPAVHLKVTKKESESISIEGSYHLLAGVHFSRAYYNTLSESFLRLIFWRCCDPYSGGKDQRLLEVKVIPNFGEKLELTWSGEKHEFSSPGAVIDFVMETLSDFISKERERAEAKTKPRV